MPQSRSCKAARGNGKWMCTRSTYYLHVASRPETNYLCRAGSPSIGSHAQLPAEPKHLCRVRPPSYRTHQPSFSSCLACASAEPVPSPAFLDVTTRTNYPSHLARPQPNHPLRVGPGNTYLKPEYSVKYHSLNESGMASTAATSAPTTLDHRDGHVLHASPASAAMKLTP